MEPVPMEAEGGPGTEAARSAVAHAQGTLAQGAGAGAAPDVHTQPRNLLPDALAQAAGGEPGAGAPGPAPAPAPGGLDQQLHPALAAFGQQVTNGWNTLLMAIREGNFAMIQSLRQPKPVLFGDEEKKGSLEAIMAWVDVALSLVQQPFQILYFFRGEPQVWAARELQQIREAPDHYPSGLDLRDRFLHRFVGQGKQGTVNAAVAGPSDAPFPASGVTMANVAAVRQGPSQGHNKRTAGNDASGGGGKVAKAVQPPNADQQKRIDHLLRINNPYTDNRAKADMRQAPMFPNNSDQWGPPPAGLRPVEDCLFFQGNQDADPVVRGEVLRYWWLCAYCKSARHWKGECESKKVADRKAANKGH